MAEFRVRRHIAAEGRLPMVCMRCGVPATILKSKRMTYKPGWLAWLLFSAIFFFPILLVHLILSLVLEKRSILNAPLCKRHEGHWQVRSLVLWSLFLGACALGIGGIVVLPHNIGGLLCFGSGIAALGWWITTAVLSETSLHATEITDDVMTLTGVSQEFLDAVVNLTNAEMADRLKEQLYFRPSSPDDPPGPEDQFYDPHKQ